jgi:hypothetical protein
MRHNPASGAIVIMLTATQDARHGTSRRRIDRIGIAGVRGREKLGEVFHRNSSSELLLLSLEGALNWKI